MFVGDLRGRREEGAYRVGQWRIASGGDAREKGLK